MTAPIVVVAFLLAHAAFAQADDDDPNPRKAEAKVLYDSASKHYDLREFKQAIDEFKKAYELLPEPLFLFDIAQSYRQLHDCENARGFYKNYLRNAPEAEDKDKVDKFISEMDQCIADAPKPIDTHTDVPPPATHPRTALKRAGLITAAAGVVISGLGVYFAIDAANQATNLQIACEQGCEAGDVLQIDADGQASRNNAIIMFSIGGAAILAGAAMTAWAVTHEAPVIITPTPGGAMVHTMVRF